MRDILEKATVRIAPHSSPTNLQALVGEDIFYEWDVDAVEVDFAVSESTFVFSPIIPKVVDNLAAHAMSRFEIGRWCWVNDCTI